MSDTAATTSDAQYWDERYAQTDRIWSGNPNVALVRQVAGLTPGTALDLGCGEGADAIWLAQQGWRVTAADVSRVALGRAAEQAVAAHVADRIDWQQHDLMKTFPDGVFDLVSAQFMHVHGDMLRKDILRSAVAAVAPGGILLLEGHTGMPDWEQHEHAHEEFPTPELVLDTLNLPEGEWEVLVSEVHERVHNAPDGQHSVRADYTVKLHRLAD